ncbi:hypothetical protein C8N46_103446 [Kordia periserrulae]|uniref:Uncharacterized protein n=1 Tax=Kordia periserrulae TaxID=701523 RepID=A0A2T6C1Z3_9FLAO|nr:hypothetical protein [Kordia periserrulae]PTX62346.1 hypothetical protein C8N46_103446 [Kordia periserrulae]
MAINNYNPKSHFFVDHSVIKDTVDDTTPENIAIKTSDSFGPVKGDESNKYRTTSVIRTITPTTVSKVFAICNGHILIQPQIGDDTKVNFILKPSETYAPFKIKYFIYRGVNKGDLINNNILQAVNDSDPNQPLFLKKIWQQFIDFNQPLYDAGIIDTPPETFPSFLIGYGADNQTDDTLISSIFFNVENNIDFFQLPKCNKGEYLGNFTGEIGLDIVLDYGDYELDYEEQLFKLDLEYARKKQHIFDITTVTGAVKQKRYREHIHQFIDAAAFWGSHIDAGEITLFNDAVPKTNVDDIYGSIVSKYQTKSKLYLYIQGERGRSYNYHSNSGQVSLDIQGTSPSTLVDYKTDDWPILIKTISPNPTEIKEFQFSFHYNIDASIHYTDIYLSAFCSFPNWGSENFITTNQLLITTNPFPGSPNHVRPHIPTRSGQSKLIQKIPAKSIGVSGNFNLVSNLLSIVVNENQPVNFLNFYDDLWQTNIKEVFTLPVGASNLCHWSSQIQNKSVELSGINIKDVTVNTRMIVDLGKNSAGTIEERKLYQIIYNNVTDENKDFHTQRGLNSAFEKNLQKSNYGSVFFDSPNCRIYKGTLDDGGTIIDTLHLVNEDHYNNKRKIIQLGVLSKEYNKLVYDSETIPDTSASGYIPFINDPANVYFHLEEDTSVPTSKIYRKFKLGLKYEDSTGTLATKFPTTDIFVYTVDDFTFFSEKYAMYQEFYEEVPKAKVQFKLKSSYSGEFGFDWMRIGDTFADGDIDYSNHVGKLYSDPAHTSVVLSRNSYSGHFKIHNELYKKLEFEYNPYPIQFENNNDIEKYFVPLLTIYPPYISPTPPIPDLDRQAIFTAPYDDDVNRVAELRLRINIREEPDILEFEYDSSLLNVSPLVINKNTGNRWINITITSLREFSIEQLIKVVAYYTDSSGVLDTMGKIVGLLRVKPNSKALRASKRVVIIPVKTHINGSASKSLTNTELEDEALVLKKFLRQILITPIIETFELDLSSNATFNSDYITNHNGQNKIIREDLSNPALPTGKLQDFLIAQNVPGTANTIANEYPPNDYFKLFYFKESGGKIDSGGNYIGLNGFTDPKSHVLSTINFVTANEVTPVHEFLHTANVEHSFTAYEASKYAKFTFEPKLTENILDYSHGSPSYFDRISLWDWQGRIAFSASDVEP